MVPEWPLEACVQVFDALIFAKSWTLRQNMMKNENPITRTGLDEHVLQRFIRSKLVK